MKVIILAAGFGSRLGKPHPKALTMLSNGVSIMQYQIKGLLRYVDINDIYVVVGYKKDLIMEAFPDLIYVYNDYYDTTNTSKSLLRGLRKTQGNDVLWLNGDVVCDHGVLAKIINHAGSCMAVNTESVAEEEVKYITAGDGAISQVSKQVENALGEAVGINKVTAEDIPLLLKHLDKCDENDYFERGIELAIESKMKIFPVDISGMICTEVDFLEDLEKANAQLSGV